jgi:hypothetical protein
MSKLWKILVGGGAVLFILGLLGTAGGMYVSFRSLKTNESAGIGAVGGVALEMAVIGAIASMIGLLLLIAGVAILVIKKSSGSGD